MIEFTSRMVGAALTSSSPICEPVNTAFCVERSVLRSRRISSMALAVLSLPYRFMIPRSIDSELAIMGMTFFCVAVRTSSIAGKSSGSAIARYRSLPATRTGTTLFFLARFLVSICAISGEIFALARSIYSTPSCICRTSRICCSVTK